MSPQAPDVSTPLQLDHLLRARQAQRLLCYREAILGQVRNTLFIKTYQTVLQKGSEQWYDQIGEDMVEISMCCIKWCREKDDSKLDIPSGNRMSLGAHVTTRLS